MSLWRPVGGLMAVALAGMFSGCSCKSERLSEVATAPAGRWNRAYVSVDYHPSFYKGGRQHPESVIHSLSIETAYPNRAYVILTMQYQGTASPELFRQMRDTTYTLQFAADDSALAASTDGGHAWTLFDLESLADSTKQPFWCRHRTFPSLSPWPSLRALALEILAAVDPAAPNAAIHRGEDTVEWPGSVRAGRAGKVTWEAEILGASRYVCVHKDDPELRTALVTAFVHPDYGFTKSDVDECVGEMARSDPAARLRLQNSLATADRVAKMQIQAALRYADPAAPSRAP